MMDGIVLRDLTTDVLNGRDSVIIRNETQRYDRALSAELLTGVHSRTSNS